jgi:hypothetical protein
MFPHFCVFDSLRDGERERPRDREKVSKWALEGALRFRGFCTSLLLEKKQIFQKSTISFLNSYNKEHSNRNLGSGHSELGWAV